MYLSLGLTYEGSQVGQHGVLQHRGCVGMDPKNSDGLCKRLLIMCYVCGVCSQLARDPRCRQYKSSATKLQWKKTLSSTNSI